MANASVILRVVGVLLLPVLLPTVVARADQPLVARVPLVQRPPTLEWGGREYESKREFEAYLRSRGASYEVWAKRHPDAAPWPVGAEPRDLYVAWGVGTALMFLLLVGGLRPGRALRPRRAGRRPAAPAASRSAPAPATRSHAPPQRPQIDLRPRPLRTVDPPPPPPPPPPTGADVAVPAPPARDAETPAPPPHTVDRAPTPTPSPSPPRAVRRRRPLSDILAARAAAVSAAVTAGARRLRSVRPVPRHRTVAPGTRPTVGGGGPATPTADHPSGVVRARERRHSLPALAAPLARRAGGAIVEAARTLVRAPVLALGAAGRRLRQRFEEETVTRADVAFYVIALLAAVAGSLIALWAAQR